LNEAGAFQTTFSLRSNHAALSFRYATLGAYNKGYTVRGSARPSPKFFFHFVPEKLRISLTLCEESRGGRVYLDYLVLNNGKVIAKSHFDMTPDSAPSTIDLYLKLIDNFHFNYKPKLS